MKKSLLAAVVLASATFATPGAWAQTDISSPPQALELIDDTAFFGDSFEAGNSGNTFADRFTFSVTGTVGQNLDAIVASVSRTAEVGLDITSFDLFDGNDTLLSEGTSMETGAVDVWTVAGGNLSAGDYYLRVDGTIVSDDGASFGGAMMLMPVPEPGAYGMMLGGLGILGFLARRRKAKRE
ncbi:FxDxF family PEP-CTERM protein [Massilia sp. Leaf139]|uniref:FxDxF family PEP-CTERM protein n=1 Tax=Massilia sp. Leaf139 TaxID=1736272 RepID=UPI0006FBA748|nr:FxDxF family PEP-CTERM protein [Massilia sp. Leaf139]KQQ89238.1 PEP-CTERM domain protein [Massilia sp. Leaf139]